MKKFEPSPDYLRGLRHGLQAGARVAYGYDRGRTWTGGEICQAIQALCLNVELVEGPPGGRKPGDEMLVAEEE